MAASMERPLVRLERVETCMRSGNKQAAIELAKALLANIERRGDFGHDREFSGALFSATQMSAGI